MASPQKENGYTAIANEILEHLCQPGISGSEYRILLFVLRKTYGFRKKQDRISLSQFQDGTLMERKQAVETIKALVAKKIVIKVDGVYKLNKNWEEWLVGKRPLAKRVVGYNPQGSGLLPTKSSGLLPTHKRKKETNTKETSSNTIVLRDDVAVSEVIKMFSEFNPVCSRMYGNTTQRKACDFLIQQYGLELVLARIALLPQTNKMPYFPTITTPVQLRDKWVQLENTVERKKSELQKSNVFKV